ncbi:vacuolar fusion protein MON1 [Trichoderma asperellum]|uniref:Vacuolar fusion protein MON1 n=1 Tax=Trichoderma asperellum TaxID=101201 RepID=A0A6V8QJ27_TRIAP|nr:vacuolar fusion protein MON1 [Trichoderma asperellum]
MGQESDSPVEEQPPPLPPRPHASSVSSAVDPKVLQAQATTAITSLDIQTLSFPDGTRGTFSTHSRSTSTPIGSGYTSPNPPRPSSSGAEGDDAASIMSFAPTMRPAGDIASLLTSSLSKKSAAWNLLKAQAANAQPFEKHYRSADDRLANFEKEFDALPDETNEYFKDDERADKLLYGLIVAGGKLVSVIRPRRHSLHPSDLQLIFNMLFESEGIKAGGGENWIPLCLPAFNNKGYLYMYVSFFEGVSGEQATAPAAAVGQPVDEEIAMILISADREAFFSLKQMRDDVAQQLAKNGSLAIIRDAARAGRPSMAQIAPGSPICHFLFKSRANVQFCMSDLEPAFSHPVKRRRLMTVYHELHASTHAKNAHLKILQCVSDDSTSLAWLTPAFELYCIGGPNLSRAAMAQGANKIMQWIKREENRLFIIGGGVF